MGPGGEASIDYEKCISCGSCVYHCPFGATVDVSSIVDVINCLKESTRKDSNNPTVAIVAPSIGSQFLYAFIFSLCIIIHIFAQSPFLSVNELLCSILSTEFIGGKGFCEECKEVRVIQRPEDVSPAFFKAFCQSAYYNSGSFVRPRTMQLLPGFHQVPWPQVSYF